MQKISKNLRMFAWLIVYLMAGFPVYAQSEKVTIQGKVIDKEDNEPIIGATIRLKNGTKGTVTDAEGKFTIEGCSPTDQFQVSFIGFTPQDFTVGKRTRFTIYLEENVQKVDEVVVTGYQTLKKNSFTGTATIVSKEELQKVNAKDAVKALQAFDPSFRIMNNLGFGSDPNQLHEINIRGVSSLPKDRGLDVESARLSQRTNLRDNPNMPIFVLDGFEVDVQKIYDMDMNRIQSMTILKDAAATALYGSRAANGVVVVTTVPPEIGEIRINYNSTLELIYPDLSDYNLTSGFEKLQVEKNAGLYEGTFDAARALKEMEYNRKLNEVRRGVNTDWLARPLRNAHNFRNYVGLSGGVNELRYMLDVNYDKNAGVMKGSYRNRYGAGMMIDYRLKDWLQIKNQVTVNRTTFEDSPFGNFGNYSTYMPYDAIYDDKGNYLRVLPMTGKTNPLWQEQILESYTGRGGITDITNNLGINLFIAKNFSFRGSFSVSQSKTDTRSFSDPKDPQYSGSANNRKGRLSNLETTNFKWNTKLLLQFNQRFDKHFVNLMGGFDLDERIDRRLYYQYEGFNLGSLNEPIYAAQQENKTADTKGQLRMVGTIGTANYSYDETYLLDLSVRLDGSSSLGAQNRFRPFSSVGLGVNMHNYSFIKNLEHISTLRIKGTYGNVGKMNFSRFDVINSYTVDSDYWYATGPAATLSTIGNPRLTWEETQTLDLGITIGLFKERIFLEGIYYRKVTDGLLDPISIRPSSGFTTYSGNVGGLRNEGFELKANATLFRNKNWSVVVNANISSNKNRITKLNPAMEEYNKQIQDNYHAEQGAYANLKTKPLSMYYVGASTSAIYAVPSLGIDPASGKEIFVKRDGSITKEWNAADMVVCGDLMPKAQGSFGLNVAYKGVYLNASFLYAFGGQIYNETLLTKVEKADIARSNVDRRILTERWHKVGDVVPFYGIKESKEVQPTSRFVQNDNYIHFNSLSLGYDFGRKITSIFRLNALSLSFNASDIARWSTVKVERGLNYPYAHTYSISLKASY